MIRLKVRARARITVILRVLVLVLYDLWMPEPGSIVDQPNAAIKTRVHVGVVYGIHSKPSLVDSQWRRMVAVDRGLGMLRQLVASLAKKGCLPLLLVPHVLGDPRLCLVWNRVHQGACN